MTTSERGRPLLVPIANPETVDRLLDTAIDIARGRDIPIVAFHIVEVPPQVPLSEGARIVTDATTELLEYADDRGAGVGVDLDTKTRYARDTATGIVDSVDTYDGSALLMGWRGRPRRRDIILGGFLDHVLREAPCDVYVKRIKQRSGSLDSILVPVAGGPHDELAAELAGTLAEQHDANIEFFHVREPQTDGIAPDSLLGDRTARIPDGVAVTTTSIRSNRVKESIIEQANRHDLTVLGATRDPFLRRRLVGSVAQGVGRDANSSVIVTRRATPDP